MNDQSTVILLLVIVFGVFFGLVQMAGDREDAEKEPVSIDQITQIAEIDGVADWLIVVLRRSGYEHSSYTFNGEASGAIVFALGKLRQARIFDVDVITNTQKELEVRAFYESTGLRRTGKYIGGFAIRSP